MSGANQELSPAEFTSLSINNHRVSQPSSRSKYSDYITATSNYHHQSPVVSSFSISSSSSSQRRDLLNPKSAHPELLELAQNSGSIDDLSLLSFNISQNSTTGLVNLGNTCYMNSILQCLMASKPFAAIFLSSKVAFPGTLAKAYAQFAEQFSYKSYGSISPASLKKVVQQRARQFIGNE